MRSLLLLIVLAGCAQFASAQGPATVSAERFENWIFTAPPGWARSEDPDGLLLTSPDREATIRLLPGEPLSSMGLKRWLDGQVERLERGLTPVNAEAPQSTTTSDHFDWIVWSRALSDRQATVSARVYFAADPRARAHLIVFTARSGEAFQRHVAAAGKLVDSVQFANILGLLKPPPQPLPPVPVPSPSDLSRLGLTGDRLMSEPIPDEFSCYLRQTSDDYSSPDLFLQILPGRQYRTAAGTGAFDILRNRDATGDVRWQSGPLGAQADGNPGVSTVSWRKEGQTIELSAAPIGPGGARRGVVCYQRGPREALARAAFERLDPRPGSYQCLTKSANNRAGTLEILPGRRYRYGASEGAYSVSIGGSQLRMAELSTLGFFGGPFGGGSGTYGLDPAGRQWYSVSSGESLECRR
jgi:hypothetical protein